MSGNPNENYLFLTDSFFKIVEKHFPLKKKTSRRNHALPGSKELRKALYSRSRLRNKFLNPDKINRKLFKQQRNKCVSIRRKSTKHYFSNITSKRVITNKNFCKTAQKQPSRDVLIKRCSQNMQQIYRRTLMLKCDFNKVVLQLY